MRKYTIKIIQKIFCFSILLCSQSLIAQGLDKIIESESKSFNQNLNALKGVPQAGEYDLKYHRLEWELNPEVFYIQGGVTSYFVPTVTGFNEMYFDFSNTLNIDSIVYHGVNLSYTQPSQDVLKIILTGTIPQNTLDSITVYYQGVPSSSTGFGAFIQSSHNNDSIIWTLSEPYGAMQWWPCKQDLNDKIDSIDVIVTTPSKYRVGSQGLLVGEVSVGNNKVYHWKHRYPIATYLISLAITNYAVYSDYVNLSQGNLEILNYVYPEDSSTAVSQTIKTIPVMELFDTLFGPYPFMNEKYGHAQFGWGGGMEHQTMSSMGNFSQPLIAHELAHQWFGDKVTCGSWSEIWLNEGFATYATGLMYKYINPTWWKAWREVALGDVVSLPDGSVYCTDTTDVSRIFNGRLTYNKGAYLLHMLHWKLDSTNFFQGVRNYLNDNNLAFSYSKTDNLKFHLENTSGQNLTGFFNDWYYGEGHPTYEVIWNQIGNNVDFQVNQTQSHSSVSFYEMPIPIYLKGQGQDTTLIFDHQFSGESFNATVNFTVDSVFFDPELWILSSNNTITLSVEEISNDESVRIFPNPAQDFLNVKTSIKNKLESIKIYDVLGKELKIDFEKVASNNFVVDLGRLPSAIYVVEVSSEKNTVQQKIHKK